jgi:hypothetical protein
MRYLEKRKTMSWNEDRIVPVHTSMSGTVLRESGLELAQALGGDTVPNAVVLVNHNSHLLLRLRVNPLGCNGDNLSLEFSSLVGGGGLLERLGSKFVLDLAGDAIVLGDVLRSDTHGQQAVFSILVIEDLVGNIWGSAGSITECHGLNTSTCNDIVKNESE